jgi:DNA-binding beta-propeller fold protein YncE
MRNLCRWIVVLALHSLIAGVAQTASLQYVYMFDGFNPFILHNPSKLVAIDPGSGTIVKTVSLSSLTRLYPDPNVLWLCTDIETSPDSRTLYIWCALGPTDDFGRYQGTGILSVDASTMTPIQWLPITDIGFGAGPSLFSPDGTRLFVANNDNSIDILSMPSGDLLGKIELGSITRALASSPGGHRLYALASGREFLFYVINLDNNQILKVVPVGDPADNDRGLSDVAVTADGSTVYVVTEVRPASGLLTSISARDWQVNWTMKLPFLPMRIIVNRAGDTAYISFLSRPDSDVAAVGIRDRIILATIPVGLAPHGLAFTPDERQVYVGSQEKPTTSIISVETNTVVNTLSGRVYGKKFIASGSDSLPIAKEFYHERFDHYFLTNNAVEIDALNAGVFEGWKPTGQTASVFPQAAGAGSVPVCRYFSAAFAPKSSHFYGLRGGDCEAVPNFFGWEYEGDVFFAARPNASGQCPAGAMPLYRVYNNGMGNAPAHRFTTNLETHQTMIAAGWTPEGPGAGVGMCVPE